MGITVFRNQPDGQQIRQFLTKTIRQNKAKPQDVICDKAGQFWCEDIKRWCRRHKVKPRFGAVGQHGSIAVIERFIRTLKDEGLHRVLVPLNLWNMCAEVNAIMDWYNRFRPHTYLGGRTPEERYRRIPAACHRPRFEPRSHWPVGSSCATPPANFSSGLRG